LTAKNLMIWF